MAQSRAAELRGAELRGAELRGAVLRAAVDSERSAMVEIPKSSDHRSLLQASFGGTSWQPQPV
ncbi:pentapeptide repeat-containing protein [Paenibacillus sp. OV219]|uniref:pentapeptide repeat-containing protein n=1 Tax=Paenibacillus sp. OV219 TaxID=1884377 RepID=UPI000B87C8B5|nr:pentapeptide repeat-containing protein [Paenibacillus sp. OV219]